MLGIKHTCTILTGKHQATTNSVLDFSVVYRGRKGQVEKLRHSVSEAEQDPDSPQDPLPAAPVSVIPELSLCSYLTLSAYDQKPILTKDGRSSPPSQSSTKALNLFAQKDFPGRVDIGKADTGGELVQLGLDPIIICHCHCHSRVCVGTKSSEDGL